MESTTAFWSQQEVIVTGGAGFLGSHLVEHLQALETDTIIVPRSFQYDLRNAEAIQQLFADHPNATMVIHLAATVGGIGANSKYPGRFFFDNIMMGTQLMEYARLAGVAKFVGIGTICSYPKITAIPFKEEDLWQGYPEETNAPYGLAKKMLLVQGQAYKQEYNYDSIHLLPVNLYGPRDDFDPEYAHVIPDVIRKMVAAKEQGIEHVTLFGDGTPTREFLYVKDAARGITLAAEHYNEPFPVNIGSSFEISIKELVTLIAEMVGFEGELRWDTDKPNGQPRRKLDVSRAEDLFGFRSVVPFREGLRETVDWYLANRENITT